MQSTNQNMNLLQLCDKISKREKLLTYHKLFLKHHIHILEQYIICIIILTGTRIKNNTSRTIRSRNDEECTGVYEIICKLLQYQGALQVEIDKFSSNLLEYQHFVLMFNQVVETKVSDQTGRLKFTDGEAKEIIKHCIHLPPETGYETALRRLNNKYGNPDHLLALYRKEIKALTSLKPGDVSGFRMFYSFVIKCETFSKSTA